MLVQERSSVTGCLFMIPVSAWGVMVRLMLRSIRAQSRLSKHLLTRKHSLYPSSDTKRSYMDKHYLTIQNLLRDKILKHSDSAMNQNLARFS